MSVCICARNLPIAYGSFPKRSQAARNLEHAVALHLALKLISLVAAHTRLTQLGQVDEVIYSDETLLPPAMVDWS